MARMVKITSDRVMFDDGTMLIVEHLPDIGDEWAEVDLGYLELEAGVYEAEFDTTSLETLVEFVKDFGIRLTSTSGMGYACPCYFFGYNGNYRYDDCISLELLRTEKVAETTKWTESYEIDYSKALEYFNENCKSEVLAARRVLLGWTTLDEYTH